MIDTWERTRPLRFRNVSEDVLASEKPPEGLENAPFSFQVLGSQRGYSRTLGNREIGTVISEPSKRVPIFVGLFCHLGNKFKFTKETYPQTKISRWFLLAGFLFRDYLLYSYNAIIQLDLAVGALADGNDNTLAAHVLSRHHLGLDSLKAHFGI